MILFPSAKGSGGTLVMLCVACLLLPPSAHVSDAGTSSDMVRNTALRSQTRAAWRARIGARLEWLDSATEPAETVRSCRSRGTEIRTFGAVRVVDVGDEVTNFPEFLSEQAQQAALRDERCVLMAFLPSCSSCAAVGFALSTERLGRSLARSTLIRVDVEEFEQDLRQLGVLAVQVPAFALVNAQGKIIDVLDSDDWPSNDPGEFLPVLSDFVRGRLLHQRGGRQSRSRTGLLKL